eukprot:TRINITY_DN4726_c0_g1_i2.p1 TRINITY_DN4726_c0_g1~~TRINITY_DN4726_c0_g1_i2.p1  ORF type:complete len:563 (-),score=125.11 TRINITY_DN4726_c0_g1_i2:77-1765(-)
MMLAVVTLAIVASILSVTDAQKPPLFKYGERSIAPEGWARLNEVEVDPHHELSFIIALKQQNLDTLDAIYWDRVNPDSPNYRNWLTSDEINAIVSPSTEDHDAVWNWLKNNGVRELVSHGDSIEGKASVKVLSHMMHTKFYTYQHQDGRKIVRIGGAYHVPENLATIIEMFSGLNTFAPAKQHKRTKKIQVTGVWDWDTYVVPQTLWGLYNIPSGITAKNNSSQAVLEWEAQYYSPADLKGFGENMAVPNIAPVTLVGTNNPNSPGDESTLDIEWIAATGLGVKNWFWIEAGDAWLYDFAVHFMATQDVPLVASMSYGWNEEDQCESGIGGAECNKLGVTSQQYVARVNTEFQKIGLRGISLFASSGDSGANGRTDESCMDSKFHPAFPASSPYVTAVGATELVDAVANLPNPPPVCKGAEYWWCGSGGTEEAVSFIPAQFASGGGFSEIAPQPSWQADAVAAFLNSTAAKKTPTSYFNTKGRGFPDMAALGNNILIWSEGGSSGTGGTSASSPIAAGIFALLNDYVIGKTNKPLGPLNPLVYKMAAEQPSTFRDITVGDNT